MIDKKHIEWYFNHMKSKGIISEGWVYDGFTLRSDKIIIRYYHNTKTKKDNQYAYIQKNSSYSFPKEMVMEELREAKLNQILDS
jgi:tRNA 2-selenouridine synthase SelU